MRSGKAKNVVAQDIFADYQRRYDEGLPIKSPQVLLDNLTEFQRNFVIEYLKDLNGSRAVMAAGYNTNNANRIAYQLLRNPRIRLTIELLQLERAKKTTVTKDYVLKKIMKIVEAVEEENPQAALRGLELLGKHLALFVERQEITGKDGEAIKYEKAEEDARDFTSAIASLAERAGARGVPLKIVGGTEG
jgi:phage terminase small subunit